MILLFIIYWWNTVTPFLEHTIRTGDSKIALLATIANKMAPSLSTRTINIITNNLDRSSVKKRRIVMSTLATIHLMGSSIMTTNLLIKFFVMTGEVKTL